VNIKLDGEFRYISELRIVVEDGKRYAYVTVGGGCNLGIDPSDPNSNAENSFTHFLNNNGFGIPILGGMSH